MNQANKTKAFIRMWALAKQGNDIQTEMLSGKKAYEHEKYRDAMCDIGVKLASIYFVYKE